MKICELQPNSITKVEFAQASVIVGAGDLAIAHAQAEATAIASDYPIDGNAYLGKLRQYSAYDLFRGFFGIY